MDFEIYNKSIQDMFINLELKYNSKNNNIIKNTTPLRVSGINFCIDSWNTKAYGLDLILQEIDKLKKEDIKINNVKIKLLLDNGLLEVGSMYNETAYLMNIIYDLCVKIDTKSKDYNFNKKIMKKLRQVDEAEFNKYNEIFTRYNILIVHRNHNAHLFSDFFPKVIYYDEIIDGRKYISWHKENEISIKDGEKILSELISILTEHKNLLEERLRQTYKPDNNN